MYNYNHEVTYNFIDDREQNKKYKQDILDSFNQKNYNFDTIIKIQEDLFDKFKNNEKFNNLLEYLQENQTLIPAKLPLKTCVTLFFSYDYFYLFHKCLKDMFNNNKISDNNYNNMIELIKKK